MLYSIHTGEAPVPQKIQSLVHLTRQPRRRALAKSIGCFALLMGDVVLLRGVFGQVIKLVAIGRGVQDVFEISLAHAQKIFVSAAEEISAIGMA